MDYESKYIDFFDVRRFNAKVSDARNVIKCDRYGFNHNTDLGELNRSRNLRQVC